LMYHHEVEPWGSVLGTNESGGVFAAPREGRIWIWRQSGKIERYTFSLSPSTSKALRGSACEYQPSGKAGRG
jgi:hypothetical protein